MTAKLNITVTTAVELTKQQVNKIQRAVGQKQTSSIKQVVDPTVIAGIKLKVGDKEIDATAYSKLKKLHTQLKSSI